MAGPVLMAAADVAMWLAILTKLGIDDAAVTSHMTKILKLGRRMIYGEARCASRGP